VLVSFTLTATEAFLCQAGECVCIYWTTTAGEELEIRCHTSGSLMGWAAGPGQPPDGSSGSWLGTGTQKNPPSPLPGNPLAPNVSVALNHAKDNARDVVRGERVGKGQWLPNRCTDLFAGNPLGLTGAQLLAYMVFRDGTGVKNENNVDVCATGMSAWTKCCQHDPVVFVCSAKFLTLSPDERARKVLHEALHVAGQFEDTNGSVGPGDPPNTTQIDDIVRNACGV
jgi:hypothetical protein